MLKKSLLIFVIVALLCGTAPFLLKRRPHLLAVVTPGKDVMRPGRWLV